MIRVCERCYGQIADREAHVVLGHIDRALPDGSIAWTHSYLHAEACAGAGQGTSPIDRPDAGEWDTRRRGISAAAAEMIAGRKRSSSAAHDMTRRL